MLDDKKKYSDMLMQLAQERPDLKDSITELQDGLDSDGKDIMSSDSEESEPAVAIAIKPEMGKKPIPADLQDDEEAEGESPMKMMMKKRAK